MTDTRVDAARVAGGRLDRPRVIPVVASAGTGPTRLAAFDAALRHAGIANFNLIRLSSVIPPGTVVAETGPGQVSPEGQWGDRLYAVWAVAVAHEPGTEAWAGLGWVQDQASGRGLFVEHEGHDRAAVQPDIDASLAAMADGRSETFGPVRSVVQGATCVGEPVCALVLAVYDTSPWSVIRLP